MSADSVLIAFAITFVAGVSTSLGALIAFCVQKKDFKKIAFAMAFSAGVMIYVSFADIMPMASEMFEKTFSQSQNLAKAAPLAMFFAGALFAGVIDAFIPEHIDTKMIDGDVSTSKISRVAIMTAVALAIHNFPEGLSVFFSTLENTRLGLALGIAILLHNIPEGISVALPIFHTTGSRKKAFLIATFSGLVEPLGAICAYFILMPILSPALIGACMAATAGIMVFIALDELLPMAKQYDDQHTAIVGVFLGMLIIAISSFI
ncbi:MAG: zinc transporter ZupT [Opitutales bacterium]|nr:zinc transporter ZupT [Opitutales bacterium]